MLGVLIGCGTFASIPILSELACTVDFDVADTLSGLSKKNDSAQDRNHMS